MTKQLSLVEVNVASSAKMSPNLLYRYQLGRAWVRGQHLVCYVMLNPSTADADKDDATIRRCIKFAKAWGFGGLLVANLFALRARDPKILAAFKDPVGPDNDLWVADAVARSQSVVAAWGAHDHPRIAERVDHLLKLMSGRQLVCLGHTKEGHPRHPLYVADGTDAVPWRPETKGTT